MEFLRQLFGSNGFMPHGYCYLWNTRLVWLNVASDALITLAYFAIPVALLWFVRKRRDVPFSWMFVLFGAFIVACGSTHGMEIWNLWHGSYWLAGGIKALTAVFSVATAVLLARLVPRAVELPALGRWMEMNASLENEVRARRETELDLRVSGAAYREQAELLDLTHDAIFVRDLESKIVYWNSGAERLYGWSKSEARQRISHELLKTEFPTALHEIEAQVYARGSWEGELVHHRRDGAGVVVSSRWALRTGAGGQPLAILESNRDITIRKRQEEKFRSLLESAPDAMVIVNQEGDIQLVNTQTEKLFGYSRQELLGQPVEILVPPRFQAHHVANRRGYSQAPRTRSMGAGLELYGRRKDGAEFPVEISLSPLQTDEGTLVSSAIRDVTDRRQTEERIRRLNSELTQKLAELSNANKELESFSYSVSHDLRAPLRHIDGFTRILKEEHSTELSEEGRGYLDRVLEAVTRMGQLVDDLLNLARIGRRELAPQRTKLDDLVRRAIAELPAEAEARNIEWRIGPLPGADCDPGLLTLVFTNLLSNAVKFTRNVQAAVIEVGTRDADGKSAIFVRDNGVGFDPKYADKLFGVFQRLHRQEDFEGTGVGLATVQRIIRRHGGEVWAESELGQGATFLFTIGLQRDRQAPTQTTEVQIDRT
ncbi:MAG TPA: PAS domain S-box protein [Candidatus Acidoferrales bacterium]|nr:PAS domain S-box protein [Candidatus Acidoferrales bacterium]